MEKNQSELCFEILRRFHKTGILDDFILIGSWCVYFYKDYFSDVPYIDQISIKTRDIDSLRAAFLAAFLPVSSDLAIAAKPSRARVIPLLFERFYDII